MVDMTGMMARPPETKDMLPLVKELKRLTYLTDGDEAQRLANLLWQNGFVIIEHNEIEE